MASVQFVDSRRDAGAAAGLESSDGDHREDSNDDKLHRDRPDVMRCLLACYVDGKAVRTMMEVGARLTAASCERGKGATVYCREMIDKSARLRERRAEGGDSQLKGRKAGSGRRVGRKGDGRWSESREVVKSSLNFWPWRRSSSVGHRPVDWSPHPHANIRLRHFFMHHATNRASRVRDDR